MRKRRRAARNDELVFLIPHGDRQDSAVGDPELTEQGKAQTKTASAIVVETLEHLGAESILLVVPEHGMRFEQMKWIFDQEANKRHFSEIKLLWTDIVGNDVCLDHNGKYYTRNGDTHLRDEFLSPTELIREYTNPWEFVEKFFLARGRDAVIILSGGPFIKLFGREKIGNAKIPICGQVAYQLDFEYKCLDPIR